VIDVHFIVKRVVVVATESAVRFCFVLFIIIFDSFLLSKIVSFSCLLVENCFV
jgi:hypothetical protein